MRTTMYRECYTVVLVSASLRFGKDCTSFDTFGEAWDYYRYYKDNTDFERVELWDTSDRTPQHPYWEMSHSIAPAVRIL